MKKENKKKILVGAGTLMFLLLPVIVLAQAQSYQLLAPLPGIDSTFTPGKDFGKLVQAIINLAIIIAALLAFVNIVIGGVQYMTGEALHAKEEGKDKIRRSIFGILILCASFLILQTINPYILNFQLEVAPVNVTTSPSLPATQTTNTASVTTRENAAFTIYDFSANAVSDEGALAQIKFKAQEIEKACKEAGKEYRYDALLPLSNGKIVTQRGRATCSK